MQRSGRRPARLRRPSAHPPRVTAEGAVFKLWWEGALIDVVLDATGIRFRQAGNSSAAGHLDWERALGMAHLPRSAREPAA